MFAKSIARVTTTTTATTTGVCLRQRSAAVCKTQTTTNRRYKSVVPSESFTEKTATKNDEGGVPIVYSLLAATAGIVTVSLASYAVEVSTAKSVPTYNPNQERFDQSTFIGRFSKMLLACDPSLLLYTQDQVQQSLKVLQNNHNQNSGIVVVDDRTLWEAKRIVDSALNENGEWIPRPFRMSGYVPYNGPICVAMVASTSTIPLLFWSWINQSQNALVNYYNRNSSSNLSNDTLLKSYGAAVGSALIVAFGLATFIQKRYDPITSQRLLRYVAFPSSMTASSLNCYIVRSPEITTGIPLLDENGTNVLPGSTSNIAAANGVYLTTASRAILQAPVFFLPPLLVGTIFSSIIKSHPVLNVPISTYTLLVAFGCGLPAAIAIFPQISEISSTTVESQYQQLINPKTNQPYDKFYYNKGL
jgi:sideroflexin-5